MSAPVDHKERLASAIAKALAARGETREPAPLEGHTSWHLPMPKATPESPDLNQWDNVTSIRKHPRWRWHKG